MKNYIWSSQMVSKINKEIEKSLCFDDEIEVEIYKDNDYLKKVVWDCENPWHYDIYSENNFTLLKGNYIQTKKWLLIDDKWFYSFLTLIIDLNKLLIKNLEKEYLHFTKIMLFADWVEILNQDLEFLHSAIKKGFLKKSQKEKILVSFINQIAFYLEKSFYSSWKIELFFFWQQDYSKF